MNCNKCGNPVPPDSEFCQYCGAGVTPPVEINTKKKRRDRYCKYCGGHIDSDTKKCTSCGKQYIRLPKRFATIILIVVTILLAGLNVYQYSEMKSMQEILADSSSRTKYVNLLQRYETMSEFYNDLKEDHANLEEWYAELKEDYDELYDKAYEAGIVEERGGVTITRNP